MSEFHARISRVRMKNGGATVSVIPTPMHYGDPSQPENWRGKIIEHAKQIASQHEPSSQLDGFVIIGMFSDGTTSIGTRFPERLPRALLPAYIAEIIRRDVITQCEAESVFDEHFQWVE